jgi:hypothetical protein
MDLDNKTRFNAVLIRGCIDEQRLYASLVVRITYRLKGDQLVLSDEQPWKVSPGPWKCDYGPLEGDELFYRGGVDLFVFGSAKAPAGKPTPTVDVTIEAGDNFKAGVRVFGKRRWEKSGNQIVMSPSEPFVEMPLTIENAFGGGDEWDQLAIPYPNNPKGKGYAYSAETVVGKELPNVEDPVHLIQKWEDQPDPVGVGPCPVGCSARFKGRIKINEKNGDLEEIKATYFNHAFPQMIVPTLDPGATIRVSGVRAEGPLQFRLPPTPVRARARIGPNHDERTVPIDQVGIEPAKSQVFITYRYPFRYRMVPLEERTCELLPS